MRNVAYQTYPNRELVIVATGQDVAGLIQSSQSRDPSLRSLSIRYLHLPGKPTIGSLRNAGAGVARGKIVASFDDDDYSHPERLRHQVGRLQSTGKSVTGYRSARFTDGRKWWFYSGVMDYVLGTSLVYWRDWWQAHPFPAIQIGEDASFCKTAYRAGQLDMVDAGEMLWATIHSGNTSPRNLTARQWKEL